MSIEVGQRIRAKRKELKLTQKDIAQKLGVSHPSVVYWEKGKNIPTGKYLYELAKILNTNPEWVLDGKSTTVTPLSKMHERIKWLPVITSVQAGMLTEQIDYDDCEYVPYLDKCSDNSFCMKVEGDSMDSGDSNALKEGSIVVVDRDLIPNNGNIIIAKLSSTNATTIKKYIEDAGKTYLKPLNPAYPVIEVNEPMEIVGVVVGSMLYRRY